MAQGLIRGAQGAAGIQWTEAAITVAVTSGGSDTTAARPQKLTGGDWSSMPFATPQAALNAIPKGLEHDVLMTIGAGTFAGMVAHGYIGKGRLRIAGSTALSTVTTGDSSGTAGTGTTSTSMNKPNAASNWTADDLRGKFLMITSGGGASGDANFPTIRPIKDNTTTALQVDEIFGMDNTSVFQIVDIATILTTASATPQDVQMRLGIVWCQASIQASKLKVNETGGWYGALAWNSQSVTISGCDMAASSGFAAGAISCTEMFFDNILLDGVYNPFVIQWTTCNNIVVQDGGAISAQHIGRGVFNVDALGCTGTALKIQDSTLISASANLNSCAVTPLDLQNIHNFRIDSFLTGTNATPTRGMVISRGGQYIITGATLAGSSSDQFEIEGRAGSYAELSGANSGTYMSRGTFIHWGASPLYTVLQTKFRVEGGEPGDDFDEAIFNNMVVGGLVKHYGGWQFLDPAYKQITAFAGGGQGSATVVGYHNTYVVNVATTGDSVRLLSSSEIAYTGGLIGSVYNGAANAFDLFPPSGKKLYLNGNSDVGTDTAYSVQPGAYVVWMSRNDTHYGIFVTPAYGVQGATSSVANTIPRFFNTSGQRIKTTNVVIDDDDELYGHKEKQNIQSGTTYTMQASDSGKVVIFTSGSAVTVTIPQTLTAGWNCRWEQRGAGQISFDGTAVTAATLNNRQSHVKSAGQYAVGGLACYTSGTPAVVTLFGDTGT